MKSKKRPKKALKPAVTPPPPKGMPLRIAIEFAPDGASMRGSPVSLSMPIGDGWRLGYRCIVSRYDYDPNRFTPTKIELIIDDVRVEPGREMP